MLLLVFWSIIDADADVDVNNDDVIFSCKDISASLEFSIEVVSFTDAVGGWWFIIVIIVDLFLESPSSISISVSSTSISSTSSVSNLPLLLLLLSLLFCPRFWFSIIVSFNLSISSRASNNSCSKLLHSSCKRDLSRWTLSTSAFQSSLSCNLHFFEFSTFNCSA